MEIVTQLAVFLANEPGTLADVCDELANADINIFALTISDTVDHSVVRMVVSDPQKALAIFEERSVLAVENDVLMIENSNRRGVLGAIARCLAEAGVNIEYAYLASSPKSDTGLLILRPSDLHRAFDILNDHSVHK
ncbi:MAG: ACT domain-containing protein [Verrucomicrobiota bacterium]|nr:ACT domain-containing protein [Verrucomicrobiota bacterium]